MTRSLTVGALMSTDPIVVPADAPLTQAAELLERHHIHGLPVVDAFGGVVGVVSQTDMLRARTTDDLWSRWPGLRVRHLMSSPALTISADADVAEAANRMELERVHRLVVVGPDGRSPVGVLSTTDLVHGMLEEARA
ncbi:MAG TPA: CBS domain-containing protein [Candidatus Limnocylindria bacterium]|jgi:CBS domain-containing protein|nr:CBS domain-containing protein [Candidatus Limnocylindria bacterium]